VFITLYDLTQYVQTIKWYHSFNFPCGVSVTGYDPSEANFQRMMKYMPEVKDKTVLDIGAWDGFYSFKMKTLGAKRVLATDHFCWNGDGWGNKKGFSIAKKLLNADVEDLEIDIPYITPETVGMWDIVLFLGVLYHRTDFFESFRHAASVTKEVLVLDTIIDNTLDPETSLIKFYPNDEVAKDYTNWFVPNKTAMREMFFSQGFRCIVEINYQQGNPLHDRTLFYAHRT
jgi:tRNA (mo5U34)-methyltransferase